MKKITISGASGFVGTELINYFESKSYQVVAIKRADLSDEQRLIEILDGSEVVINLSGANIIHRWSESYKKLLYSSRIDSTKALIEAMESCNNRPKLFISTSAVGIYKNDKIYDELTTELNDDFLANLCKEWEAEALKADDLSIRTAIFRFGIVLGSEGGALAKMLTPFRLGVGGTIGDGSQAFSFIHIDDLLSAYEYMIESDSLDGIFNLTSPNPTTNYALTKALGKSLKRPTILPLPEFVVNLIFGEGAKVLTDGQSALPKRLLDSGFEFRYESIEETINSLLSHR